MIQPSIDELLKKTDNKYSLAIIAAKRARDLVDGAEIMTDAPTNKGVSLALCEIGDGRIKYRFLNNNDENI